MPNPLGKSVPLKIAAYGFLLSFLYIVLPVYLKAFTPQHLKTTIIFYFLNILLSAVVLKRNSSHAYRLESGIQDLQEKLNLLSADFTKNQNENTALIEKDLRINSLKMILDKMNQTLDLDAVADILTTETFSLISDRRGVCALYLIDQHSQKIKIFKTKKDDPTLIIKAKEGDIFDYWVLRHANPLLVEDVKNDFRFDPEKLRAQDSRPVLSLISSPLLSENKFLGILRVDSSEPNFFNQDDLRFLVALSDLGAVELENSELFKKTQDLAIHDSLTSFYSKGYFSDRLKSEFSRCLRNKSPLSILMLDIDLFKNYNDKFGHMAGDIVLKNISSLISESLVKFNPIISRFGGEEFCAILTGIGKDEAMRAAQDLRIKIEKERILLRRVESHVTVSIGVAALTDGIKDEDELIRNADKAMYQAKQSGRNRVCCI